MGQLLEASKLLQQIDSKAVAQLAGMPDWSANVALAQGEIAWRQGDYTSARKYVDSAAPVFHRADAEPFQRQALDTLSAAIDRRLPAR
jgi:hypothetical protein